MVIEGKVGHKTFFQVATLLASPQNFDRANKQPCVLQRRKQWTMYVMMHYHWYISSQISKSTVFLCSGKESSRLDSPRQSPLIARVQSGVSVERQRSENLTSASGWYEYTLPGCPEPFGATFDSKTVRIGSW